MATRTIALSLKQFGVLRSAMEQLTWGAIDDCPACKETEDLCAEHQDYMDIQDKLIDIEVGAEEGHACAIRVIGAAEKAGE